MVQRISDLMARGQTFAFETTLSSKSFSGTVKKAQKNGYRVILIFFWLESIAMAKERVAIRVAEGGHAIDEATIGRRYRRGIHNLFNVYFEIVDELFIFDNSFGVPQLFARKPYKSALITFDDTKFQQFKRSAEQA
jgi:predicted ABC-type ATPase